MAAKWRVKRLRGDPLADGVEDLILADKTANVDAELGEGRDGKVVVGIDEAGQQHPSMKIDDARRGAAPRLRRIGIADIHDLIAKHRHGLRRGLDGIDRVDRSVEKQPVGFSVCWRCGPRRFR